MGDKTSIGWTEATWNALRGCSRTIAPGATDSGCGDPTGGGCYAERNGYRFAGTGLAYEGLVRMTPKGARWTGKVLLVDDKLLDPLRWQRPRMIFTTSVSDPNHERFSNETIALLHGVIAITPHHTHQWLTKRAERLPEWDAWVRRESAAANDGRGMSPAAFCFTLLQRYVAHDPLGAFSDGGRKLLASRKVIDRAMSAVWPLPNLWRGVSCEHQLAADYRVPPLLQSEAAVRFVSAEPLIGAIDMTNVRAADSLVGIDALRGLGPRNVTPRPQLNRIDWVIAGCESGPGARAADTAWFRSLRDQCDAAGTAFFLKQAEEHTLDKVEMSTGKIVDQIGFGPGTERKGANQTLLDLPYLDGVQHAQFPERAL